MPPRRSNTPLRYAKERIQSVPVWEMKNPDAKAVPIIQHPDVRRDLLWMKAHVEGIRALNYFAAYCMDMAKANPAERDKWQGFVELLTPVCKAYSSDKAMEVCSKAIDVYGGYGYCQEYPVEQYMRDCKIACLYEGTNGIQALDLVGRKLGQKKGMNVMNMFGEIGATIAKAKGIDELKDYAARLEEAYNALVDLTMTLGPARQELQLPHPHPECLSLSRHFRGCAGRSFPPSVGSHLPRKS